MRVLVLQNPDECKECGAGAGRPCSRCKQNTKVIILVVVVRMIIVVRMMMIMVVRTKMINMFTKSGMKPNPQQGFGYSN